MEVSIALGFFLIGLFFGSFYHVVGYRMPKGESIIKPPSHCPNCNHRLTPLELIPVLSFIIQGGKCKICKSKISIFYPIAEILCGLLFMFAYLSFGLSPQLIIAITFISMLIIVIFSDYYYMIIEDKVLVFFGILLIIEMFFIDGFTSLLHSLLSGLIASIAMFLLKTMGDFLFKKESMGWGDIKLMFVIGLATNWYMALISVVLAAFIALIPSLIIISKKKEHILPFGPFLSVAAIIILLTKFDIKWLLTLFTIN